MPIDDAYLVKTFGKTSSEIGEEARKVGKDKFALYLTNLWSGIGISYNGAHFIKDPHTFTEFQISQHRKKLEISNKELNIEDKIYHDSVDLELTINRSIQFLPEGYTGLFYKLLKAAFYLTSLSEKVLGLDSISDVYKRTYLDCKDRSREYTLRLKYNSIGLNFIDTQILYSCGFLDDSVTENLITWRKIQDELIFVHTRLVNTSVKSVNSQKNFLEDFFPNESLDE